MTSVDMSFENMIQNRRNGVKGVGRGRGMQGVRGPAGTFRGDGRLAGPPCRGPLGMYDLGGTFRGVGRLAGPPRRGPLVMYGPGGTCTGVGRLAGPPCRGPLIVYGPGGTCRGARRLAGPPRRGSMGTYAVAKTMCKTGNLPYQNNVLKGRFKSVGSSGVESGTKLQVSNLSDGVSNEDIRELFSEIGEPVRYGIHYDKNESPCGSAEVVFARRSDAFQAVERYNNTQFHGKPMKIENLGSIVRAHVASRLNLTSGHNGRRSLLKTRGPGYMRNTAILDDGTGSSNQRACGGMTGGVHIRGIGGRGRVHGRRGERPGEKLAGEHDEELENRQAKTTQTEEETQSDNLYKP